MSLRRRILRIALTVFVILGFAGYFAFSTFLFSPLESDFEFELATLVPRNVDFLVAKTNLSSDFGDFPQLAFAERFEASRAGSEFLASPEWQRFEAESGIQEGLANLELNLDQAPITIDPLAALGGRELLVAGYFKGADLAAADLVIMGRTNWVGKLAVSMLGFSGLVGLEDQGYSVVEEDGVTSIDGGELTRPLYIARIADVLILGTSQPLVAGALKLEAAKGQDSFGLSARYADYIQGQESREREDLELFVDNDALMKNLAFDGKLPDMNSQDFTPAFLGRLFQLQLLKEAEGVVGFDGGVSLNLHADVSSEKLTSAQKRFYRAPDFNRERLLEVARLAPRDTGIMAYLQADVGDVLRMVLASTEPALQDNFNDLVRSVWGYPEGSALIDEIDAGLKDRLALVVRELDYVEKGIDGPPHDDRPAFAWAVVGWVKDRGVLDDFRQKVISNQGRFGIQGRGSGTAGVFLHDVAGGLRVTEYWSPLIPGTGHMASVTSSEFFILSNHNQLLGDILLTNLGDPSHPNLAEGPAFSSLVSLGLASASGFLWFNPEPISGTLHAMAAQAARDNVQINWDIERPRIDQLVRKRDFGGRAAEALNPDEYSTYETSLEEELVRFESQFFAENVGGLAETYDRTMTYVDAIKGMLLELALDPKRVDIFWRAQIPLNE